MEALIKRNRQEKSPSFLDKAKARLLSFSISSSSSSDQSKPIVDNSQTRDENGDPCSLCSSCGSIDFVRLFQDAEFTDTVEYYLDDVLTSDCIFCMLLVKGIKQRLLLDSMLVCRTTFGLLE